jgi:hypothetical protein
MAHIDPSVAHIRVDMGRIHPSVNHIRVDMSRGRVDMNGGRVDVIHIDLSVAHIRVVMGRVNPSVNHIRVDMNGGRVDAEEVRLRRSASNFDANREPFTAGHIDLDTAGVELVATRASLNACQAGPAGAKL